MKGEERKEQERSGEIDTAHDKSFFLLIKSLVRVGWREGEGERERERERERN